MSENGNGQVVPTKVKPARVKHMTRRAADAYIGQLPVPIMSADKMHAYAKVGQFMEQEGEHHIARTIIAGVYARLEQSLAHCEQTLAELDKVEDPDLRATLNAELVKRRLFILAEMNASARNLNMTRAKVDPKTDDSPPPVPTMPARTEITNNTQIVLQTPREPVSS